MNKEENKKTIFRLKDRTLVIIDWANVYGWFSNPKSRSYLGWEVDPKKLFKYLSTYPEITDKRLYHGVEIGNKRSEDFGDEIQNIGFTFIKKDVKWVPVYLNEQNHFKRVIKKLFDVLDKVKVTNSEIATKLYELRTKIEKRLADIEPDFDRGDDGEPYVVGITPSYAKKDGAIYNEAYDLIENLDTELKSLNINVDELQASLLEPTKRRKCDFDVEIARDVFNLSNDFDTLMLFSGDGDYAALVEDLISKDKKVILVFAPGHKGKEYEQLQKELVIKGKKYTLFICTVKHLKDQISA
ncbi:MAG: hypothetical protein COU06_01455 [Candidatus Harrisonbacteria bacterium CG10_big_fil_rev_8_21_14_0_10_38_8]|uniref:NYN domain-containing protein n=1 Tax=Candidatus Harrisonbacteria bacterium CG10_big_fil_rev_8_21_14_0_10_38_8 TaxID=1974582 RepID=A0A2M6WK54_9BACT|nr:MAG: hypothetical protein COU06_01455 [Candidatus Harrisonbacteria bacterium CG10_big_fil_rev_8_21_14_0_10_38_8]